MLPKTSGVLLMCLVVFAEQVCHGDEPKAKPVPPARDSAKGDELTPLNKSGTVQIDLKGKRLLVKSTVVMREGLLEMLVCLKQTKEHESLLSVDAKAQVIHAGLIDRGGSRQPGAVRSRVQIRDRAADRHLLHLDRCRRQAASRPGSIVGPSCDAAVFR